MSSRNLTYNLIPCSRRTTGSVLQVSARLSSAASHKSPEWAKPIPLPSSTFQSARQCTRFDTGYRGENSRTLRRQSRLCTSGRLAIPASHMLWMSTTHEKLFGIESVQGLIGFRTLGIHEFHKLARIFEKMGTCVLPNSEFASCPTGTNPPDCPRTNCDCCETSHNQDLCET